jgi:hypothetical protein
VHKFTSLVELFYVNKNLEENLVTAIAGDRARNLNILGLIFILQSPLYQADFNFKKKLKKLMPYIQTKHPTVWLYI